MNLNIDTCCRVLKKKMFKGFRDVYFIITDLSWVTFNDFDIDMDSISNSFTIL